MRASASAARRQRASESEFTRVPSTASSAGSVTSAAVAASSATAAPPIPIENRKRCGNTSSDASAAATISAEKATVRPAVRRVRVSAGRPGPSLAISSR
jgi:hypothetical protein